jgi:hypothetical protein
MENVNFYFEAFTIWSKMQVQDSYCAKKAAGVTEDEQPQRHPPQKSPLIYRQNYHPRKKIPPGCRPENQNKTATPSHPTNSVYFYPKAHPERIAPTEHPISNSQTPPYGKAELRERARFISERKPLSGLDRSRAYRLVLICPAPETISSDSQSDVFADSRRRTSCQVR